MQLIVTIKRISEIQVISDKFKKREIAATDNSSAEYPQTILFQLSQDKVSLADNLKLNDVVEISFNIRGREWTSPQGELKVFNTLDAWKITTQVDGSEMPLSDTQEESIESDNLPF